MNTIPQHDLVANIRKKLRDPKNRKILKIINNGTFVGTICSKIGINSCSTKFIVLSVIKM